MARVCPYGAWANTAFAIFQDTVEDHNKLIVQFCEKLSAATSFQEVCLKVINLLFTSLKRSSPVKYDVYYSLVSLAGKVDQVSR